MELPALLGLIPDLIGSGAFLAVIWMLAKGHLIPGSVHREALEDRNFYRDKLFETTALIGDVLSNAEVVEGEVPHEPS